MSFGGLHWWNFWSRHTGALYGVRGTHPRWGRVVFVYGGKTFQRPWTARIEQHLWGGGRYSSVPKPWADTVLGWRPNGTVEECIAAGGVFLIMEPRKISPMGLWWREIVFAIWLRLPLYNVQWNLHNPRRVRPDVAREQRVKRDLSRVTNPVVVGSPGGALKVARRWVSAPVAAMAVLSTLLLLIPGVPTAVEDGVVWSWSNPLELLILVVVSMFALRSPRRALRQKRR